MDCSDACDPKKTWKADLNISILYHYCQWGDKGLGAGVFAAYVEAVFFCLMWGWFQMAGGVLDGALEDVVYLGRGLARQWFRRGGRLWRWFVHGDLDSVGRVVRLIGVEVHYQVTALYFAGKF